MMAGPTARTLLLVLRVGLAALFLFAGGAKLLDPSAFAVEIDNYQLLPWLAPYLAVALPSVEIVLGIALLVSPPSWRAAAALGCFVLMAAFTFAAASAMARGLDINCGCFGASSGSITWLTLVRDLGLLAVSALLMWPGAEPAQAAA